MFVYEKDADRIRAQSAHQDRVDRPGIAVVGSLQTPVDHTEKLVTVIELKLLGDSAGSDGRARCHPGTAQPRCKARTVSNVADLSSCPAGRSTATSGRSRRAAMCETGVRRQFTRLDG